jgi:large subunit ribosomal protein L32
MTSFTEWKSWAWGKARASKATRQEERIRMAVPKKKQSKTRGDKRAANWKAKAPSYAECPQCRQPKLPHVVCGNCGYYAGRQAIEVE